jgi:hypothetical protein
MPILTREQFIELEDRIDRLYDIRMNQAPDYVSQIFNVQDSNRSEERHEGIGELAIMTPWGGTVAYDGFSTTYEKRYRHAKYSTGIQFEDEIFRFKEYNKIAQRVNKAATSVYKTVQTYGASVFNNAFNSAAAGPDGQALCSTAHPYSPSDPSVQVNAGTSDLSVESLDDTIEKMCDFKDDRGDLLGTVQPNILLVGNSLARTARKIVGSEKEAFTGDNTVNLFNGELQVIVFPYIKGKKWFVCDGAMMSELLNWYFARRAKPERDTDFDTEVIKFKLVTLFSFGFDDWRFIYGHNPG